ncbi:MAG TPA: hypothetical protein VKM55_04230 [Candidatus Lokiarchaeia archaeon]|nr:hypothetical protein [Candidatus Lokiarchaeia archaeon]
MAKHALLVSFVKGECNEQSGYRCKSLDARRDFASRFGAMRDSEWRRSPREETPLKPPTVAAGPRIACGSASCRASPERCGKPDYRDARQSIANATIWCHCDPRIVRTPGLSPRGHPAETPRHDPTSKCVGFRRFGPKDQSASN